MRHRNTPQRVAAPTRPVNAVKDDVDLREIPMHKTGRRTIISVYLIAALVTAWSLSRSSVALGQGCSVTGGYHAYIVYHAGGGCGGGLEGTGIAAYDLRVGRREGANPPTYVDVEGTSILAYPNQRGSSQRSRIISGVQLPPSAQFAIPGCYCGGQIANFILKWPLSEWQAGINYELEWRPTGAGPNAWLRVVAELPFPVGSFPAPLPSCQPCSSGLEGSERGGSAWLFGNGNVEIEEDGATSIPAVSQWGLIVLALLFLVVGTLHAGRGQLALVPAGAGIAMAPGRAPIIMSASVLVKCLCAALAVYAIACAAAYRFQGELAVRDAVGGLMTAVLAAYVLHLWLAMRKTS